MVNKTNKKTNNNINMKSYIHTHILLIDNNDDEEWVY